MSRITLRQEHVQVGGCVFVIRDSRLCNQRCTLKVEENHESTRDKGFRVPCSVVGWIHDFVRGKTNSM